MPSCRSDKWSARWTPISIRCARELSSIFATEATIEDQESTIRLGITIGDPGGIGPEVILKALSEATGRDYEAVIFGARKVLEFEEHSLLESVQDYEPIVDELEVVEVAPDLEWEQPGRGPSGRRGAILQKRALDCAMEAVAAGAIDAIVTAPWNKALFSSIDEPVVGHTEVLSDYFGAEEVVMMLAGPRLRVALVTTHIALSEVAGALGPEEIEQTIEVTARALKDRFGISAPRIAVCGLNPHAGEKGHMGRDELDLIEPLLARLAQERDLSGVDIEGPFPADTLFAKFKNNAPYDAVICMYHDQGLIPLKVLHFGESANITLGLPVVRTSVDHGTAYDIAGKGVADAGSMKYAIEMALEMVRRRKEAGDER